MFLTSSDTRRTDASIIVYKFRPDVRIVYATFLALLPWVEGGGC